MDLRGGGGELWGHAECVAGKNRMPGVHLSGYAAGDGGDVRDLGDIEHRSEPGGVDRGDGSGEVVARRRGGRTPAQDPMVVRCMDERAGGDYSRESSAGLPGVW